MHSVHCIRAWTCSSATHRSTLSHIACRTRDSLDAGQQPGALAAPGLQPQYPALPLTASRAPAQMQTARCAKLISSTVGRALTNPCDASQEAYSPDAALDEYQTDPRTDDGIAAHYPQQQSSTWDSRAGSEPSQRPSSSASVCPSALGAAGRSADLLPACPLILVIRDLCHWLSWPSEIFAI